VDLPPPEIADVRSYRKGYLVRFSGVHDRTQAEPYRGFYLLRPFAEVAEKDEGEFFYHELLGLVVETVDGVRVGEVTEVFPVEPEQMLQVTGGERSLLVPFSRRIVREIDLDRGRILIDPPEGLLDL
jgi:16S rRNA processing protein RimM